VRCIPLPRTILRRDRRGADLRASPPDTAATAAQNQQRTAHRRAHSLLANVSHKLVSTASNNSFVRALTASRL